MRGISLFAKALGLTFLMAFVPILTIGLTLSHLAFWPFPIQQTIVLILVAGALFNWYLMQTCYEHSSLAWTYNLPYSPPIRLRLLISSPLRRPYVLFQVQPGNIWMTRERCDLTMLPISTADQEKLLTFLEGIPQLSLGDQARIRQAFDYICAQFSHDPMNQIYLGLSGKTQNKI